jgi:hypothetical protein
MPRDTIYTPPASVPQYCLPGCFLLDIWKIWKTIELRRSGRNRQTKSAGCGLRNSRSQRGTLSSQANPANSGAYKAPQDAFRDGRYCNAPRPPRCRTEEEAVNGQSRYNAGDFRAGTAIDRKRLGLLDPVFSAESTQCDFLGTSGTIPVFAPLASAAHAYLPRQ